MRVLMTSDCVGGVWTYALELADALAERDVEVTLAVMGAALRLDQREELRRVRVERVYAETFALEWMPDCGRDLERAADWLLRIRDEVEPDLVHLNAYAHVALPWRAPTVVVGHSCVLSWHEAVRGRPAPLEWDAYRELVTAALGSADLLVAPTRAMLSALERLYEPRCPTLVIPNGRTAPRLRGVPKEPLVVSAGRLWDEAKNVEALVRLAPRLEWPVAVAGEGWRPAVHANLTVAGRLSRPDLDHLLARASVFALPARYEPFGLAPLEAALAGSALVLGDIPSLREVWGDAALFVDPDDAPGLEATLGRLIADVGLRARLARAAHERASTLTPEGMAHGYLDAYERVLEDARVEVA